MLDTLIISDICLLILVGLIRIPCGVEWGLLLLLLAFVLIVLLLSRILWRKLLLAFAIKTVIFDSLVDEMLLLGLICFLVFVASKKFLYQFWSHRPRLCLSWPWQRTIQVGIFAWVWWVDIFCWISHLTWSVNYLLVIINRLIIKLKWWNYFRYLLCPVLRKSIILDLGSFLWVILILNAHQILWVLLSHIIDNWWKSVFRVFFRGSLHLLLRVFLHNFRLVIKVAHGLTVMNTIRHRCSINRLSLRLLFFLHWPSSFFIFIFTNSSYFWLKLLHYLFKFSTLFFLLS